MKEQQALNLPWYTTLLELWSHEEEYDSAIPNSKKRHSQAIQEKFQNRFIAIWNTERRSNRKLRFYNTIKDSFSQEKYLQLTQKWNQGRAADLAKLRMSANKLNIETGRYKNKPVEIRICHLCTTSDEETVDAFLQLPFLELFVESEQHLLTECPYYEDIRRSLPESIRSKGDNFKSLLTDDSYVLHAARYVSNLFKRSDKGIKERGNIIL